MTLIEKRYIIFLVRKMDEIEKNNILQKIIKKFDLSKGQYIDYEFFKKIYEEYKQIFTEKEFATLLGLTNSKYKNIKFYNGKASILMNIEKSVEEKENILNKIVQENDLQKGDFISYDKKDENVKSTFIELYNQYKGSFTEYEFANLLGIKNENLRNIRRSSKKQMIPKARVLMNQCATDDEKYEFYKEKIEKQIIDKYEGKKIDYEMLHRLYRPYRTKLMEYEFAELIGITKEYYYTIKYIKGKQGYIRDFTVIYKANKIKESLEERYYSKDEIQELCKKYKIGIKQFIIYVIQNQKFYNTNKYINVLNTEGRLWLKHCKMSNDFVEKNYENLKKKMEMLAKKNCLKYEIDYDIEEIVSKAIEYMYTNCGDIEKNFKQDEDMLNKMIYTRVRLYIRAECVKIVTRNNKTVSLNEKSNRGVEEKIDRVKYNKNENEYENIETEMLINQILREVQEKRKLNYSKKDIIQELIIKYDITPEIIQRLIERDKCKEEKEEDERC